MTRYCVSERKSARRRAEQLRAEGYGWKTIAKEVGVSASTVRRLLDPEFAEQSRVSSLEAKRRRSANCIDCGRLIRFDAARCPACYGIHSRTFQHDEIVRLRVEEGLTQVEIARRIGCGQTNVSRVLILNGLGVGRGKVPAARVRS